MLGSSQLGRLALGQLPSDVTAAPPLVATPLSIPVRQRIKPRLAIALMASGLFAPVLNPEQINQTYESRWHQPWSVPKRFKPGVQAQYQRFFTHDTILPPVPAGLIEGWYNWFNQPVRLPRGLKAKLQQTVAMPPRLLPNPDVTLILNATENNGDVALFSVRTYNPAVDAVASIREH